MPGTAALRPIAGRTILVVDDEPLILLDLAQAIEGAGAIVLPASSIQMAMTYTEDTNLSGAVLDWIGADVCQRLTERGLPFVFYSGRSAGEFAGWRAPLITKPANLDEVIAALELLL